MKMHKSTHNVAGTQGHKLPHNSGIISTLSRLH